MKTSLRFLMTSAALLGASSLSFAAPKEHLVRFQTADGNYVLIGGGGFTYLGDKKEDHRQVFTLIDLNGGEIADGDEVHVRTDAGGSKPTYWINGGENVWRGRKPEPVTIKKVKDQYMFHMGDQKFITESVDKMLVLMDDEKFALKVKIIPAVAPATPEPEKPKKK